MSSWGQCTPATCRTTTHHARTDTNAHAAEMANTHTYEPVLSTMMPVTSGATIPDNWPATFWAPAQRPAARGPASVAVTAKAVGVESPKNAPAAPSSTRHTVDRGSTYAEHAMVSATPRPLVSRNALRTRVAVAPRAIHRSETTPALAVVTA